MAINRTSPKKGKVVDIPDAAITIGTPTAGDASVSVAFTASSPATGGPVQKYTAISTPGSVTVSGSTSPINVTGLTNGTAYTIQVAAANATGNGVFSSASASATPFLAASYDSIATVNLSSGSSTVSFTSIPSTYKHLQIRYSLTASTPADTGLRFNSDSGANYSSHLFRGTGTAAQGYPYASSNQIYAQFNIGFNTSVAVIDIFDYTNTSKNTAIRSLAGWDNNGSGEIDLWGGAWYNTAAVSSIDLVALTATFSANSKFALYGIKG
jgi:hypothetical protein